MAGARFGEASLRRNARRDSRSRVHKTNPRSTPAGDQNKSKLHNLVAFPLLVPAQQRNACDADAVPATCHSLTVAYRTSVELTSHCGLHLKEIVDSVRCP